MPLKVGDKVMYKKYSGSEVKQDGEEYILIKAEDTMVIIEGNLNGRNDSYIDFQRLPDWQMKTVSTHNYFGLGRYVFFVIHHNKI